MGIKYQRKEFLGRPVRSVALPGSVVTATTRRTRLSLVKSGSTEKNPAFWKAMISVSRDCAAAASCADELRGERGIELERCDQFARQRLQRRLGPVHRRGVPVHVNVRILHRLDQRVGRRDGQSPGGALLHARQQGPGRDPGRGALRVGITPAREPLGHRGPSRTARSGGRRGTACLAAPTFLPMTRPCRPGVRRTSWWRRAGARW